MTLISRLTRMVSGQFYMTPPEGHRNEVVVMVHGLIRRGRNMYYMGRKINRAGYTVYVYDYATTRKRISGHGKDFRLFLEKIAAENPGKKINIVTHSMGGIITREALGHISDEGCPLFPDNFKRVVMLAPPNHGSNAAKRAIRLLPFTKKLIKPLPELSSEKDAYIHKVPFIPEGIDIGIIAGRFDMEVSLRYTYLYNMKSHTVINSEHSFMVYMPQAVKLSIKYLKTGSF